MITVIAFLFCYKAFGHEILTNWKVDKRSEDIEISYRNINVGDTLITRQIRLSFEVNARPEELIPMFKNSAFLNEWSAGTKNCEVIMKEGEKWMTYSLYDVPWPFNKRDLITEYVMEEGDGQIILHLNGRPDYLPVKKGIIRLVDFEARWIFTLLPNGRTKAEFYSIAFTTPIFPRIVQDPVVQKILINSVHRLKNCLYRNYESTCRRQLFDGDKNK